MGDVESMSREALAAAITDLYGAHSDYHIEAVEAARRLRADGERIATLQQERDDMVGQLDSLSAAYERIGELEEALRELASYVGNGGYNAPGPINVPQFIAKIRDGIDQAGRPTASNNKVDAIKVGGRVRSSQGVYHGFVGVVTAVKSAYDVKLDRLPDDVVRYHDTELTRLPPEPAVRNITVPILATNADDESEVDALMNRKRSEGETALKSILDDARNRALYGAPWPSSNKPEPAVPDADGTLHDRIHPTSGRLMHASPVLPANSSATLTGSAVRPSAARMAQLRALAAEWLAHEQTVGAHPRDIAAGDCLTDALGELDRVLAGVAEVAKYCDDLGNNASRVWAHEVAAKLRSL